MYLLFRLILRLSTAAAAGTVEYLHVAKVDLKSKGSSTRPVSLSTATLRATEVTESKSAGGLREELGT